MINMFTALQQLKQDPQKLVQFKQMIEKSGKTPEELLNELIKTGRVSKDQVEQVTNLVRLIRLTGGKL